MCIDVSIVTKMYRYIYIYIYIYLCVCVCVCVCVRVYVRQTLNSERRILSTMIQTQPQHLNAKSGSREVPVEVERMVVHEKEVCTERVLANASKRDGAQA